MARARAVIVAAARHDGGMRVFISSVRRGLEEERDALPGLISAIGFTPRRFEDYSAQPRPSRQACVDGVNECDVYLLLLGAYYGYEFDDSNQSPTHDEWTAAQAAGKPTLVFRKTNVEMEPKQVEFDRMVSNYRTGRFYVAYDNTADLLTKVAQSLREQAATPGPLTFAPLEGPVLFVWRSEFEPAQRGWNSGRRPELELHVRGVGATRARSRREMFDLAEALPSAVRAAGLVPHAVAVDLNQVQDGSLVLAVPAPPRRGGFRDATPGALAGLRVGTDGQVSMWATLPQDTLGAVIDEDEAGEQFARMLRIIGSLQLIDVESVAVGVGVDSTFMISFGKAATLPRSGAVSLGTGSDQLARVIPDEAMSAAALTVGSSEAGRLLARDLIVELSHRR
jgi:hypothetical protein